MVPPGGAGPLNLVLMGSSAILHKELGADNDEWYAF